MATKNYLINDKWLDIDKQNIVELQSVDGEIDSVKVNGEDYGGGGGGSSDFSTAEVTLSLTLSDNTTISDERLIDAYLDYPDENFGYMANTLEATNHKVSVLMYNSHAIVGGIRAINTEHARYSIIEGTPTTTGGVTYDIDEGIFYVTGDGTITAELSAE